MPEEHAPATAPRPFVFVLMPFKTSFNDIYRFGIKDAAQEVGAYAERVDEQDFQGGMLERIYNQISKADVIVADMTGQNANVFYEVGYAHALGKVVVLLTQKVEDIPFDLRHHQHIVYGGDIGSLREKLTRKLDWAFEEARKGARVRPRNLPRISFWGTEIPERSPGVAPSAIAMRAFRNPAELVFTIRNTGETALPALSHVYLMVQETNELAFGRFKGAEFDRWPPMDVLPQDAGEGFQRMYRVPGATPPIPPLGAEPLDTGFTFEKTPAGPHLLRIRVCMESSVHDFDAMLEVIY